MKTYHVYILKCNDDSFYTGVTSSLENRYIKHQVGYYRNCYTFSRRPVELVFAQAYFSILQAIEFEKKIKGWSRRKKIALINDNWDDIIKFSRNYTQFGK